MCSYHDASLTHLMQSSQLTWHDGTPRSLNSNWKLSRGVSRSVAGHLFICSVIQFSWRQSLNYNIIKILIKNVHVITFINIFVISFLELPEGGHSDYGRWGFPKCSTELLWGVSEVWEGAEDGAVRRLFSTWFPRSVQK